MLRLLMLGLAPTGPNLFSGFLISGRIFPTGTLLTFLTLEEGCCCRLIAGEDEKKPCCSDGDGVVSRKGLDTADGRCC